MQQLLSEKVHGGDTLNFEYEKIIGIILEETSWAEQSHTQDFL